MNSAPQIPGFLVRPLTPDDAEAWASCVCLPEVMQHTSSTARTVEEVRAVIERGLAATPGFPTRFIVTDAGTGAIVATVGFHSVSLQFGTGEIAFDVAPAYWGKGIATAACRAATLWAFDVAGWHRVQATTVLANVRSQRVLEKCGFKREGLVRNFRIVRGSPADYWMYSAIPGEVQAPA